LVNLNQDCYIQKLRFSNYSDLNIDNITIFDLKTILYFYYKSILVLKYD